MLHMRCQWALGTPKPVQHCLQGPLNQRLLSHHRPARQSGRRQLSQQFQAGAERSTDDTAPVQQQLSASARDDVLQQLELLRRQLDDAVAQEDYSRAQQLKQQTDALKQQLSPVQQYVQAQIPKLRSGSLAEKAEALKGIGEAGTFDCLPDMAPLLADPELGDAAQEAMWRIFARTPNTEVQRLMEHGGGLMERGNYPIALEAFEAAATLEPSFAEAHNKRATVLYLMDKYKESIELCKLVLELNPYHFAAAAGMGMCYVKMADFRGALTAFERALQIHPGMKHIQRYILALKDQLPGEVE